MNRRNVTENTEPDFVANKRDRLHEAVRKLSP